MERQLSTPSKTDKYYLKKGYGGYNPCVLGNKNHRYSKGSVLVNCVGYATGRFNAIIGAKKCSYLGNTNAENFYALAKKQGLSVGNEPREGACMVWAKGKAGVSSDGAGHVAIVEKVYSKDKVLTSESGWGYTTKYTSNVTRYLGTGHWSLAGYTFLGFVYNPQIDPYETPTDSVIRPGEKGEKVKWMQWAICKAGYKIAIDGSFGPATQAALKKAQKAWKLTADGICGPKTQAKIKSLYTLQ